MNKRLDKWALRRRRASDVSVGPWGIEGNDWETIKRWQKEFQDEFCAFCKNFEIRRLPDGKCELHWTDIIGRCWNFRE